MADALVSPAVAGIAALASAFFIALAVRRISRGPHEHIAPLMGVMGAFVFVAQMINFTIPGTGSSGHIIGGILLSVVLGPWAGLLTLVSVLLIQSLFFADGGLLALGCNVFNMAVLSCLVAYPFVFRPLMQTSASRMRIMVASVLACVVGLELGALAVSLETILSGVTALPPGRFLSLMLFIHLFVGLGEGLATGAVLCFLKQQLPELLKSLPSSPSRLGVVGLFLGVALLVGLAFSWLASSLPDGLEWAVSKTAETSLVEDSDIHRQAGQLQQSLSLMPEYNHSLAGVLGAILTVCFIGIVVFLFRLEVNGDKRS